MKYRFDEEGIKGETEGLASSDIRWEMPVKAQRSGDSLLIFITPRQYLYVPLDEHREELLALVRSKVGTFVE